MILQCPKCKKQYTVDSSRVTERGVKITCPACKHQFVARKRREDGGVTKSPSRDKTPPPKAKPARPRTPPCVVCGAPSTHVFPGPTPRPLCERHFQVEKEKSSRFFEPEKPEPDSDDAWDFESAAPEPPPEPKAPKTTAPPAEEPEFDSFDDSFVSFDDEPKSRPESRPDEPEQKTESTGEAPDDFTASAHEFMMPGSGLVEANAPSEESPDPETGEGPAPETEEPAPPIERFGEEEMNAPEPAAGRAAASDGLDFSEDIKFFDGHAQDPDKQEDESTARPEMTAPREEAEDFTFEPALRAEAPGPSPLEAELEKPAPSASPAPAAGPGPLPAKTDFGRLSRAALRPRRQTAGPGMGSALSSLLVILIAVAGSVFITFSGFGESDRVAGAELQLPALEWFESLDKVERVAESASARPSLSARGPAVMKHLGDKRLAAIREARRLMFADRQSSYEQALRVLAGHLNQYPGDLEALALKVELLAFSESLAETGEVVFRAEDSASALAVMTPEQLEKTTMLRPRAHSLINQQKPGEAGVLLDRYLQAHPNDPVALYLAGMRLWIDDPPDLARARVHLERAVSLEPEFIRARWQLAAVLRGLKKFDEAVRAYEELAARAGERPGVKAALESALKEREAEKLVRSPAPGPERTQVMDLAPRVPMELPAAPEPVMIPQISANLIKAIIKVQPDMLRFDRETKARREAATPRVQYERPPEEAPPE